MENLTARDAGQVQPVWREKATLARNQAHSQIHAFMDCYQKEIIGRLAPNPPSLAQSHNTMPLKSRSDQGQETEPASEGHHPKSDRARLHKIWLAMKPVYKPATVF